MFPDWVTTFRAAEAPKPPRRELKRLPIKRGSMWKFTGCIMWLFTVVYWRFVSWRGNRLGFVPVWMFEQDRMPRVSREESVLGTF